MVLSAELQRLLPHARLTAVPLDTVLPLRLWLIEDVGMDRPLSEPETNSVWESPPFWSFCWGSGLALADWIADNAELVAGKTVVDFGCGSGVVGIAALKAGAARVIACDLDPVALQAAKSNAKLNQVDLVYSDDLFVLSEQADWLFAADVLYDPDNLMLIREFSRFAKNILIGDSRIKNFSEPGYQKIGEMYRVTQPDLGENEDVKTVRLYQYTLKGEPQ